MCACARQASAEDPENNGSLLEDTPESERGGERARSQEDYTRADFIKPEGGNGGKEGEIKKKKKVQERGWEDGRGEEDREAKYQEEQGAEESGNRGWRVRVCK